MVRRGSLHFAAAILVLVVFGSNIAAGPSGSGRISFISDRGGKPQIYLMNADGSNISLLIDPPGRLGSSDKIAFSPDGRKIALSCGGNVCVMNTDGSNMIVLTSGRGPVFVP